MRRGLGPFTAAQIDFGFFLDGELEGFEIGILMGAIAKRLVGRTAATAPPIIPCFQLYGVGRLLRTNWFRHESLLLVIIGYVLPDTRPVNGMVSTLHSLGIFGRELQLATLALHELAVLAIQPVSFTVQATECVCLTGPSGVGKSMLLRAVADLIPHTGDASLDEQDCSQMKPSQWRKQVGYLPAESHWWSEQVGDHFTEIDPEVFGQLGFEPEVLNWQVSRLSTGEKQRLALLRLLANQPRALLLDEPTASLDAANVGNAEALIRDYRQQQQAAVIWVSHDPAQIQRVASRVLRLENNIVQEVAA